MASSKGFIAVVVLSALIGAVYSKKCAKCALAVNSVGDLGMDIDGDVTFEQESSSSSITIKVEASGFNETGSSSQHGFHVHALNDLTSGCNSLGSHYNPNNFNHSMPNNTDKNNTQFGVNPCMENIFSELAQGFVLRLRRRRDPYADPLQIHSGEDDLGLGGDAESLATGNAGSRWACCIIVEDDCSAALGLHSNILLGCLLSLTILMANIM